MLYRHVFYNIKIFIFYVLFPTTFFFLMYSFIEFKDMLFFINNNYFQLSIFISGVFYILPLFLATNSRNTNRNSIWFFFLFFIPLIYIFINTNNSVIFFIVYELFLVPSYFIIKFYSPNRRSIYIANYFLIWTQLGSFLVLIGLLSAVYSSKKFNFNCLELTSYESILIFFGFGVKVPIWPFHYWLTKTHTEAPTFFSIYLSGFLVKTALFGIWVFVFYNKNINFIIYFIFISIGIFDASMKMWVQVDIKKLVAFATIQEMNLILLLMLVSNYNSIKFTFFFILAHTLLSSIFFYIVDVIYKRYGTRSVYSINGLINNTPYLSFLIIFSCILFSGLPFTLKFIVEIYLFTQIVSINSLFTFLLILVSNWIAIVSFTKHWYSLLFGGSSLKRIDLNKKEIIFFLIYQVSLVLLPFYTNYII